MTGQVSDQVRYDGEVYSLAGIDGEGFYTPADFGIETRMASTACWRGYVMFYDCVDGKLLLQSMHANLVEPKPINDIKPTMPEESWMFKYAYEKLALKTKFTGSIWIGKDFIDSLYVHMGFQSVESYRTVMRLDVEDGDIISVADLSKEMEMRRQKGKHKPDAPLSMDEEDLHSWVSDRFSQDYDAP